MQSILFNSIGNNNCVKLEFQFEGANVPNLLMKTYLLVSNKLWHDSLYNELKNDVEGHWVRLKSADDFSYKNVETYQPDWVFIVHWSEMIPKDIYKSFNCVVFHMTDLPFGRGGSPLQNLILRGCKNTKVSAIKVEEGLDTGPVYLKSSEISLLGTAEEIFIRLNGAISNLIRQIVSANPTPMPQTGDPVIFKRRKPEESTIEGLSELSSVYDYIRMLDAEGYPPAFLETDNFRFEFKRASMKHDSVIADVRIIKK